MANLSDFLFNSTAASVGTWVRLVHNVTGLPYVSTAATSASGLFTVSNVPSGSYTLQTGPTNTGPWVSTTDTNYIVPTSVLNIYTLTDQANIFPDASLGDYFKLNAGGNRTINIPANPVSGQLIRFDIKNNTAGAITTTWVSVFTLAETWSDPGVGNHKVITFVYDGSNWIEQARSADNPYLSLTGTTQTINGVTIDASGNVAARSFTSSLSSIPAGTPAGSMGPWNIIVPAPVATAATNRANINAAIAAAVAIPGAKIKLYPGNYHIDQALAANFPANTALDIAGAGQGVTIITQDTAATDIFQIGVVNANNSYMRFSDMTLSCTRYGFNLNNCLFGEFERLIVLGGTSAFFLQGQNESHVFRNVRMLSQTGRAFDAKGNLNGGTNVAYNFPEMQKCKFDHVRINGCTGTWAVDVSGAIYNALQSVSGDNEFDHVLFEGNTGGDIRLGYTFNTSLAHVTNEDAFLSDNTITAILFDTGCGHVAMRSCHLAGTLTNGHTYQYVINQVDGTLFAEHCNFAVTGPAATADLSLGGIEVMLLNCVVTSAAKVALGASATNRSLFINTMDPNGLPITNMSGASIETTGGIATFPTGLLGQVGATNKPGLSLGSANLGLNNPRFVEYDDASNAIYESIDGGGILYRRSSIGGFVWHSVPAGATRYSAPGTELMRLSLAGDLTTLKGGAFWGHAAVGAQPAAPVTLADVIAIIRGCGLSA